MYNAAPTDLTGKTCLVAGAASCMSAIAWIYSRGQMTLVATQTIGFDGGKVLR